jgi:hypothetical protein
MATQKATSNSRIRASQGYNANPKQKAKAGVNKDANKGGKSTTVGNKGGAVRGQARATAVKAKAAARKATKTTARSQPKSTASSRRAKRLG